MSSVKKTFTWDAEQGCLVEKVKPQRPKVHEVDVYNSFFYQGKEIGSRGDEKDVFNRTGNYRTPFNEIDHAFADYGERLKDPSISQDELDAENLELSARMKREQDKNQEPGLIDPNDESATRDNLDRIAAESRAMSEGHMEAPEGPTIVINKNSRTAEMHFPDGSRESIPMPKGAEQAMAPQAQERISWSGGR